MVLSFLLFLPVAVAAWLAAGPSEAGAGTGPSDDQAMMEQFLKQEALRLDATFLAGITNRQQFEARRPELRAQYLEMLGLSPWPERTPLQARVTGILERDEGFRVEKLHFQSRPHLYVTGNLYLPRDAKAGAKLPAVLYVCGHSGRGRDGNKAAFQHHGMWFATHGYVCLIIDTLQLGEIAAIHHGTYRYDRWGWQARGYTPAAVECWNGVRALDYLQSRPEVDPDRLAVTGISGGGAATFWIAAADERVKVAVPVSGMSDLEDYVGEKVVNGHCDCMFLINAFQWPWTSIAALIAPRPLLFENSGHDTIFPMDGNDRIRARLERLYSFYVLGEGDSLDSKPDWATKVIGDSAALLVAPRGWGPVPWPDPSPHYLKRALPLLGRTLDSCRLGDVLAAASNVLPERNQPPWNIVGRGAAGVIAAYAALLEPRWFQEIVAIDPPTSHREGPIFLNVLRVLDIPDALGLLAPRPLTVYTAESGAFARTASLYQVGGGKFRLERMP